MRKIHQIATELAAMQPEELANLYEAWKEEIFNNKVQPVILAFRNIELDEEEANKLFIKLKNIAWCEEQKKQRGDRK